MLFVLVSTRTVVNLTVKIKAQAVLFGFVGVDTLRMCISSSSSMNQSVLGMASFKLVGTTSRVT